MAHLESLAWEMLILSSLALLYYLYQRRKILSPKGPRDLLSGTEWNMYLYELHTFLESEQDKKNYTLLNEAVLRLEDAYIHQNLSQFGVELNIISDYSSLPAPLKEKTKTIRERF